MRRLAARSAGPKLMPWMRGLAAAISSRFDTPSAVSRIACTRIGRSRPDLASSWASRRSTKWMSHAPSTFGIITTSSRSPISVTSVVMSSSIHGESSALTRVHSAVSPRSISMPIFTSPARAASLLSTGIASSRFPSTMSALAAVSGSFPTIFSLLGSKKWIIRDGLTGISVTGSGAPTASGFAKSRGLRKVRVLLGGYGGGRRGRLSAAKRIERPALCAIGISPGRSALCGAESVPLLGFPAAAKQPQKDFMSTDTATEHRLDTDQATREASGSHPYGRYLEEFEVGAVYKHWPAKTITEADDHLFCLITMNHHPLHINDVYAAESQQGRNVVVGPLVYSLMLGMTVSDVSGKAIANLATEELKHPAPVFHGDTLFVESEVLEVTPSRSKPDRGVVKVKTDAYKQDGTLVATFKRAVLVPKKNPG